jgi:hypothetical protein
LNPWQRVHDAFTGLLLFWTPGFPKNSIKINEAESSPALSPMLSDMFFPDPETEKQRGHEMPVI